MIINLNEQQIHFDLEHETPYFQASDENRVRNIIIFKMSLEQKYLRLKQKRQFLLRLYRNCRFLRLEKIDCV